MCEQIDTVCTGEDWFIIVIHFAVLLVNANVHSCSHEVPVIDI